MVVTAAIACVQIQSSTLGLGIGSNNASYASITNSSQVLQIDIPSNLVNLGNISASGNIVAENVTANNTVTTSILSASGNINAGNIDGGNLVTANYFLGVLTTAAQPNITSVGTLSSLTVSGNVNANIVNANYLYGDGSNITNISVSTSSTITNGTSNVNIPSTNGNVLISVGGTANVANFTSTGTTFLNTVTMGNATLGNTANANYFIGSGNNLSNIQGANVSGTVANATYATTAGTAYSVSAANITGTVNLANYATTANAVAGANVSGTVANATYATTAGTAYSVSASNITGTVNLANFATTANAVALANVSGAGNIASINLSGNSSQVLYGNGAFAAAPSGGLTTFTRSSTWQSSSGAVTVPAVDVPIYVRSACTLIEATILTQGGTGSCVVDIWKTPIGTYPPTSANSICGGNYPSITSGTTLVKTSLTGWTTAVSAGDTIMFHLTSSSTFTYITIQLTFST